MSDRCPTCGQAVTVHTGSEGTSSYVKLAEAQLNEARTCLARLDLSHDERGDRWRHEVLARLSPPSEGK